MADAIAVLNAGSSSIKFSLFAVRGAALELTLRGQIEGLYTSDATAPPRWQEKDGLRRILRQQVRGMAHDNDVLDNVISGNRTDGVILSGGAHDNHFRHNKIGTNAEGTQDVGNLEDGVLIDDADNNTIGGTTESAGNVISANFGNGIQLKGGAIANVVEGNRISEIVSFDPISAMQGTARRPAAGDVEIDATGKYVLPGLINNHAHVQEERGGIPQPLDYELKIWLACGITTVRDVGSETKKTIAGTTAHRKIASGYWRVISNLPCSLARCQPARSSL